MNTELNYLEENLAHIEGKKDKKPKLSNWKENHRKQYPKMKTFDAKLQIKKATEQVKKQVQQQTQKAIKEAIQEGIKSAFK